MSVERLCSDVSMQPKRKSTAQFSRNPQITKGLHRCKPFALPERRVTLRSGHMGNTFALCGENALVSWKECCPMDERLRFVARLLEGEKMATLCREFDV